MIGEAYKLPKVEDQDINDSWLANAEQDPVKLWRHFEETNPSLALEIQKIANVNAAGDVDESARALRLVTFMYTALEIAGNREYVTSEETALSEGSILKRLRHILAARRMHQDGATTS